jgi:hypothetical protein
MPRRSSAAGRASSVLVVVDVVPGVPVAAVDVVDVVAVRDGRVAASLRVDVHVPGMRQVVPDEVHRAGVDVVLVNVVHVPIVEEVDVVVVGYGRVPAVPVVAVRMLLARQVGGVGHGVGHGSPNRPRRQTPAGKPSSRQ